MTNKTGHILARVTHKITYDIKILIVINKYIPGNTLENILKEWEYNVIGFCTSGREALVRVRKDKPHLVLTDIELSDCNGIHLVQQLSLQAHSSKLCIYFTAYATDLIMQRTMNSAVIRGYNINKDGFEKLHKNFESSFCQYYDSDQTMSPIVQSHAQPIRILLVDDQQIVLWGLEKLIDSEKSRMEVVGKATNTADARSLIIEKQPDILVLNIYLDNIDCVNIIPDFTNSGNTRVLIFTETHNKEIIDRAVLSGARGVVHRKESMQTILRAIEKIYEGELWLDRITTGRIFLQNSRPRGKMLNDTDSGKVATLTRKECIVLRAFSDGMGGEQNKQIAAKLCMSEHTLRNHLTSIFSKLGIKNRFSLFAYAKQHFQQSGS